MTPQEFIELRKSLRRQVINLVYWKLETSLFRPVNDKISSEVHHKIKRELQEKGFFKFPTFRIKRNISRQIIEIHQKS
jgi:hypothetical protein